MAQELHSERWAAAQLLTNEANDADDAGIFNTQAERTDEAIEGYQTARGRLGNVPDLVGDRLARVDDQLAELARPGVRPARRRKLARGRTVWLVGHQDLT